MKNEIKLFEERNVRTVWNEETEEWYFSIVDVIEILTDTDRPRKYWNDLKKKLQKEGSELSEKIGQLKIPWSDGKNYMTDLVSIQQLFRMIQSIPSPKVEPFNIITT
ncbi:MAG: BRO family protein [Bacteroidota bacterium]